MNHIIKLQPGGSDIPDLGQLFYSPTGVDLMGKIHSPESPKVNISQLAIPPQVKCGPGAFTCLFGINIDLIRVKEFREKEKDNVHKIST